MTELLTFDRFRDLADAYGSAVARWPEPVRAAAMRMAIEPAAAAILAGAAALDTTLDAWRVPAPDRSFQDRVTRTAPASGTGFATRPGLWWSGLGIAAALAGAAVGTAAIAAVAPPDAPVESNTSFGDIAGQEV
jgi:hypothetical protein